MERLDEQADTCLLARVSMRAKCTHSRHAFSLFVRARCIGCVSYYMYVPFLLPATILSMVVEGGEV